MKKFFLIIVVLFSLKGFSQVYSGVPLDDFTIRLGYNHNRKSKNTGFLGLGYVKGDSFLASTTLYGGVHYLKYEEKARFIPEIGVDFHLVFLSAGASLNSQAFQPKIGLSLLSIANITAGYSLPINKEKMFKGFTLGVHLQIPMLKRK
ncbi:hypothetical protein CAPN010_20710 [Capnocytophaga cynodegmi]|uniref:hypothetical protein n=1 Tax=Capnocytophaga cynodegmi TaxID=28189 RepID=UPI001EE36DA0|nr:hypothetical protein [Capnocytophaga cynodegmi]GJQ07913.1 hypothetical protein CAPN010_20710 [Capnocytophaga cynodegmi]